MQDLIDSFVMPSLFESEHFSIRELRREQLPNLQTLFEGDPEYFVIISGKPPASDEAQRELDALPPPGLPYSSRWFAGIFDTRNLLKGVVVLVTDFVASRVWHIALFFLDRELRGLGAAMEVHGALEAKAIASGACWLRLVVMSGNPSAERFWVKCGYVQVRNRPDSNATGQPGAARVMVKPLGGSTLTEYLKVVPRDQPSSPLP